jgi:hypothetical protein
MLLFFVGMVVGFMGTIVALRSLKDKKNADGVDGKFDVLQHNLKDLLRQLHLVHNEVGNPNITTYSVRRDVNRCLQSLLSVILQLKYLSRLSEDSEVQAKWEDLQRGAEELDEYLQTEFGETINAAPIFKELPER